jgi:phosphate starvation-inducible protein PhoH
MIYEQYQTTIQRMKERMTKIAKQFGIAIDGHTGKLDHMRLVRERR